MWIIPAVCLAIAALTLLTPVTAQARDGGRGCYCSGWECGDADILRIRWCCHNWPSSDRGCSWFVTSCMDNVE